MKGKAGLEPVVTVPTGLTRDHESIISAWPDRFREKVQVSDACWEWIAGKSRGYGRYSIGKKPNGQSIVVNAHRHSWELVNGPTPDGFHVDHLCRNHSCVRPDHLEAVPPKVNSERGRQANVSGLCRAGEHAWVQPNILNEGASKRCRPCRDERERAYRPPNGNAQADRTHCPSGHPYDEENTRRRANGSRDCRACHRVQERIKYRTRRGLPITEEHYAA